MNATLAPERVRKPLRQYDSAAFHASIEPDDCFICTYPKSGTTWLAFALAQLRRSPGDAELDLKSMNRYVPDVNLLYTKGGTLGEFTGLTKPRLFHCHATFDPHFPRVIYVVRDPRDTLLSYWHYQKFLSADFNQPLGEYIEAGNHWPCEWDLHVESWLLPRRHPRLLLLKYEQMHQDAAGVLQQAAEFAGVEASRQQVIEAVEASRFDRMRAAEEKHGQYHKNGDSGERFVRKGRIGSWREEMSTAEAARIEQRYARAMELLGYA